QGIEFLFMITVGGPFSVWGAVLGATVITLLKTLLQGVLPKLISVTGDFEVIVFGVLIVIVLQWMRGGIWVFIEKLLPPKPDKPVGRESNLKVRQQPARGTPLLKVDAIRK